MSKKDAHSTKKKQLFVLPFAGGSALSFKKLNRYIADDIDLMTIEYAGRGHRKGEKFIHDYEKFLVDVAQVINAQISDVPFALLGYSMGGFIAYDLIKKGLLKAPPMHIFICACSSPIRANFTDTINMNDCEFEKKILKFGGINVEDIDSDNEYIKTYLEVIKNDYVILNQYRFDNYVLEINISVMYNKMDESCTYVDEWRMVAGKECDFFEVGNGHFFLTECSEEMADIIGYKMLKDADY